MNILIFTPTVGRGGVHLVVRKLLAGFAHYAPPDWQFTVLGQTYDEIGLPVAYPAHWQHYQIDPLPKLPAHPRQFEFLWRSVERFYSHLRRFAGDYDLIYCPSAWWVIRVTNWDIQTPFITTIPDFAFDEIGMGQLLEQHFRDATKKIRDRAHHVTFPSAYWQQHALTHYAYDPARTTIIPHSADFVADEFEPTLESALRVREKYHLPERYVLAFHCLYHKDPFTILRAQQIARSQSPDVPPLVLAGIGTEHLLTTDPVDHHIDAVRATLREIGATIGQDVFVVGQVPNEDIAGLYVGATVSVSASTMEGDIAGGTFNAFMAHCPHIYSELPVYRARLSDDYGWSFPVGDAASLAKRLIEVCHNRDEARRRAVAAYGWAARYTLRDVVQSYLQLFESVRYGKMG